MLMSHVMCCAAIYCYAQSGRQQGHYTELHHDLLPYTQIMANMGGIILDGKDRQELPTWDEQTNGLNGRKVPAELPEARGFYNALVRLHCTR